MRSTEATIAGVKKGSGRGKLFLLDKDFVQVLLLGWCFMLIATASRTCTNIQKIVLESVKGEDPSFHGDGYISLSIMYAFYALFAWFSPSIIAVLQPKRSLIVATIFYVLYIAGFLFPSDWVLYCNSVTSGIASAVLWTAQGSFLALVSMPETVSRNSGIFWGMSQSNAVFGNLLVYWQFQGKANIDAGTRRVIFTALTIVCTIGLISLFFLQDVVSGSGKSGTQGLQVECHQRRSVKFGTMDSESEDAETASLNNNNKDKQGQLKECRSVRMKHVPDSNGGGLVLAAVMAFREAFNLFFEPHMLLLSITSLYTGLEMSFYAGVFSTSVGFTKAFGSDSQKLVGLIGIFVGIGAMSSGLLFGIFGNFTTKKGSAPVIFLGIAVHVTSFVFIFLSLPNVAAQWPTDEVSYFNPPSVPIAIVCALSLGFGDSCFQTQLMALLASHYSDKSAAAFAISKFIQSGAAAASFFSSKYIGLHTKLWILALVGLLSSVTFVFVDWALKRDRRRHEANVRPNNEI